MSSLDVDQEVFHSVNYLTCSNRKVNKNRLGLHKRTDKQEMTKILINEKFIFICIIKTKFCTNFINEALVSFI